jgi:hypothetical protein
LNAGLEITRKTIMTLIANETSQDYTFTRNGISLLVRHVPTQVRRDLDGDEIRTFSMGVTMRLEELIADALGKLEPGQVSVELEF